MLYKRVKNDNMMNIFEYLGLGIIHEKNREGCQDAVGHLFSKNGNVVMVLSDGASSAKYAEQAAWATVQAIINFFDVMPLAVYASFDETRQRKAVLDVCKKNIKELSRKWKTDSVIDFSATLLFSVFDGKKLVTGHIGDGAIFCMDNQENIVFCSEPDNVGSRSGKTCFVTSPDSFKHFHIHFMDMTNIVSLLMMSDGAYPMFQIRGNGMAQTTVKEILSYIRQGRIGCNEDLADVLNQMAEVPSERLDDWSVIILSKAAIRKKNMPVHVVSMLTEEEEKYAEGEIRMD